MVRVRGLEGRVWMPCVGTGLSFALETLLSHQGFAS